MFYVQHNVCISLMGLQLQMTVFNGTMQEIQNLQK